MNNFEECKSSLQSLVKEYGIVTVLRALEGCSSFGRGRPVASTASERKGEREVREMLGAIVKAVRYVRAR